MEISEKSKLMTESEEITIKLYSSNWCGHSISVERFLARNDVEVERISIDGNKEARRHLIEINNGYASVPTLVFPDGSKLTEPSFREIREKLSLESGPPITARVRELLSRKDTE